MQPAHVFCPQCGSTNQLDAYRCIGCGTRLIGDTQECIGTTTTVAAGESPANSTLITAASPTIPASSPFAGELQHGTLLGLNNRYRIDQLLGRGGFSATYLAYDTQLQR